MSEINNLTVNIYRDGFVESSHEVCVYSNSKISNDYFFPRSAVKPMQVMPLLIEASKQNVEFNLKEIALFSSSHSGQREHTDFIDSVANKFLINLENLECGPQRPFHEETADLLIRQGKNFTNLHNNCSGKHLSMLIFSKLLGEDQNEYCQLSHKTQEVIKNYFIEIFDTKDIGFGIDGCGLPAIKLKVSNFLNSIQKMQDSNNSKIWNNVFKAYMQYPIIIGGEQRTDTNIIINSKQDLMAKSGAEGVLFVSNNNESLVFNCRDGSKRGVDLAATSYLHKIGWISKEPYKYIESTLIFNKQNIRAVEIEVV
jgi:L-asparaginase II